MSFGLTVLVNVKMFDMADQRKVGGALCLQKLLNRPTLLLRHRSVTPLFGGNGFPREQNLL